jgi:hypothetical protein
LWEHLDESRRLSGDAAASRDDDLGVTLHLRNANFEGVNENGIVAEAFARKCFLEFIACRTLVNHFSVRSSDGRMHRLVTSLARDVFPQTALTGPSEFLL